MPGLSKVIVLDPDVRAGQQVQLGFERESVPAVTIPVDGAKLELPGDDAGLVVVGGSDGQSLELIRRTRALLDFRQIDVPLIFAGRGIERSDAQAAGADEAVLQPAYLRDVVTVGRLLRGRPFGQRDHIMGSLAQLTGMFPLVRALASMGRSATLTLARGLRRGEIRFYHGEVTSAQLGITHGQAALHQLLLWTDARFDFHHEDVVRRHQIPLTHDELLADAERFLASVRESSGGLSPSMVLEPDLDRVRSFGKQIPTEVHGVLRMFDGYRVLSDVLEDSAYRVFETLRVAQRAVEIGALRIVNKQPVRVSWRAILSIEDWLLGSEPRTKTVDAEPVSAQPSGPPAREPEPAPARKPEPAPAPAQKSKSSRKARRNKKRRRHNTPIPMPRIAPPPPPLQMPPVDWGTLVPRITGAEVGPLAGVVPAAHVSGEIVALPRAAARDNPDEQPSIVFDETAEQVEAERAKAEALAQAEAKRAKAEARARAEAEAEARAKVVDDLQLDDTKPERRFTHPNSNANDAITAPIIAPPPPAEQITEPAAFTSAKVPQPRSTPTNVAAVAAVEAEIADEPSDGIIRHHITTADTAPVKRRRNPTDPPEDDRPGDMSGEITMPRPRVMAEPRRSEPTILVPDLAELHAAVSKLANEQATAPVTANAASPPPEAEVVSVPSDAVASSDVEEAFFRTGGEKAAVMVKAMPIESFNDLDEGYQPVGFWDRFRGRGLPDRGSQPDISAQADISAQPDLLGKPGNPDDLGKPDRPDKPDKPNKE